MATPVDINRFKTRSPPTFQDAAHERQYRLERVAGACRIFGRMGFADGLLGHITVRDPEDPALFWVTPLGVSFRKMHAGDLVQVNHAGEVLIGDRPVNPVGLLLHSAVHKARPEVQAICHAHSVYGQAWSSLGRPLDPITQDTCVFFERQALIREPRVARDAQESEAFADAFGSNKVAIQVGHGLFSTGLTVDEAAWWFISLDKACRIQLLAEAAGKPERWPDDRARAIAAGLGSPGFGWASFQTLWDELIDSDPDLFAGRT